MNRAEDPEAKLAGRLPSSLFLILSLSFLDPYPFYCFLQKGRGKGREQRKEKFKCSSLANILTKS